jgi:DNA-binding CsgD family transcriptional regulator
MAGMDEENTAEDKGLLLTPREVALLSWFVIDGEERLSIEDAAARLGIQPYTARALISRAKSKLRVYAGHRWPLRQD